SAANGRAREDGRMRWIVASRVWVAAGMLLALFGAACTGRAVPKEDKAAPSAPAKADASSWPMFGGTVHRNLANADATGIPDTWSVKEGKEKNVKWSAKLGNKALGGPVVAGGHIYVGTNRMYDSTEEEDKGVVMCFNEADGKFLWQSVHDDLKDGS